MRPSARTRRLGQNFLADPRAAHRMLDALAPEPATPLVEIGPGHGAITRHAVALGCRVVAIEIDGRLVAELSARFGEAIELIHASVLDVDLVALAARLGGALRVLGNLPYSISKPVAMKLVAERAAVSRAVLTFQREVAERLTAGPGSRAFGPLSVLAAEAYDVEALFELSPRAFRPPPAVASTVTRWVVRADGPADEPALRACLAAAFARRRRTLRNNLRAALGSLERAEDVLARAELDPELRAEAVPVAGFRRLAAVWRERVLV